MKYKILSLAFFLLFSFLLAPRFTTTVLAATGDVLADFVPSGTTGLGRGMAFDGTNLYYTLYGNSNIYKVTTTGSAVATIPVAGAVAAGGPLAWDGAALWTMNYSTSSFVLYKVNPTDGSIISSCNIQTQNPTHPAVTSASPLNIGYSPDGLDWSGSSLWISSEVFSGNWVVEVDTSCNILKAFNPPANLGDSGQFAGTSGVAFDGVNLWHATPTNSNTDMLFFQTDTSGTVVGTTFVSDRLEEDLAYDTKTFAPKCAIWANEATFGTNHLTAYEVPGACPTPPSLQVNIDINNGNGKCIDNKQHWELKVSILGSNSLDVNQIDPTSLKLENVPIKTNGKKDKARFEIKDVNNDSIADLVAEFKGDSAIFAPNQTQVTLTGNLFDGTPIVGTTSICIKSDQENSDNENSDE